MNEIAVINVMPSNKKEIDNFVKGVKEIILSGNENPLKIAVQLAAMEKVIKQLRSDNDIKNYSLQEAEKHGKNFDLYNSNIQIKEVGVKYDFTNCGDDILNDLIINRDKLDEKIKTRKNMLKTITEQIADVNTGVIINPAIRKSTTSIVITLK